MMDHPLLKNIKALFIYILIWVAIIVTHFVYLALKPELSASVAMVDSLVFNTLFALLGFAIWFMIEFLNPSTKHYLKFIVTHILFLIVILLLWLGIGTAVMIYNFNNTLYTNSLFDTLLVRLLIGVFFYVILLLYYNLHIYYIGLQSRIQAESQLVEKVKEAEVNLLRSQINPHFLFNALNSISSLVLTKPDKSREMLIQLSDYLRYSINEYDSDLIALEKELINVERYLQIEQVRFGSKMKFIFDIEPTCKPLLLPPMILQPLFENAVKHGVYESIEPVEIYTKIKKEGNLMRIEIVNNFDPEAPPRKGAGIGLTNIKERLRLIYGASDLLRTNKGEQQFEAVVIIPIL